MRGSVVLIESCIASRRRMPSPPSRALSVLTACPSTREAPWSAGKLRCASRLTTQARCRPRHLIDAPSRRGAHHHVTGHEANEAALHRAVESDEERYRGKVGQGDEASAMIYVRSKEELRTPSSTRVRGLRRSIRRQTVRSIGSKGRCANWRTGAV